MQIIIDADETTVSALLTAARVGLEGLFDPEARQMVGMTEETVDAAFDLLTSLANGSNDGDQSL